MATLTLYFTPASPTPANGYRIKYKLRGSSDAYTVTTATSSPAVITGVVEASNYEGTVESDCGGYFSSVAAFVTCSCPDGYSRNPENTGCYKVDVVSATPPTGGVALNTLAMRSGAYSTCGSYIYNAGYNTNGTGTSTRIDLSNAFWTNGFQGDCVNRSNLSAGPLNRTGLWVDNSNPDDLIDQTIGFSVCLDLDETTTYYIGIAGDNVPSVKIDGNVVVNMNTTAMGTQYGLDSQVTFKIWHIYPVTLSSGPHNIELIGYNISSVASLGAEVYKMNASRFAAITSYSDFTSGELVFSTKDFIGMPAQLGSGGAGYSCPSGYALSNCSGGTPTCQRTLTTECS